MKPIKLVMSRFGSYINETIVDFQKFWPKGLFLVTGDTGAGKTTIFDAVCYALYGRLSSEYKETKSVESNCDNLDAKCFVEFTFTHQNRIYTVRRNPEHRRNAKRGGGIIIEKENAILYGEEGKVLLEGLSKVNEEIGRLLNITMNQFKQLVMIAQGEFWELLNADTATRTEILRKIFGTGRYQTMSNRLRDKMLSDKKAMEEAESSILQYFRDVLTAENSAYSEKVKQYQFEQKISRSAWNVETLLFVIDAVVEEDKESLQKINREIQTLEDELRKKDVEIDGAKRNQQMLRRKEQLEAECTYLTSQKAEMEKRQSDFMRLKCATHDVKPVYDSFKEIKGNLNAKKREVIAKEEEAVKTQRELEEVREKMKAAISREAEKSENERLAARIKESEEQYRQREEVLQKESDLQKENKCLSLAEQQCEKERKHLTEVISDLKKEIDENGNLPAKKVLLEKQQERLAPLYTELDNLYQELEGPYKKLEGKLADARTLYCDREKIYDKKKKEFEAAEKELRCNRIGLLATELREGEPCPVCGSVHHPNPAKLTDTNDRTPLSSQQLDELKTSLEDAKQNRDTAFTEAERLNAQADERKNNLLNTAGRLLQSEDCGIYGETCAEIGSLAALVWKAKENVAAKITENEERLAKVNASCELLERRKAQLKAAEGEESEKISQRESRIREQRQAYDMAAAANERAKELLTELPYPDWNTATRVMAEANDAAQQIMKLIDALREKCNQAENRNSSAWSELGLLKNQEKHLTDEKKKRQEAFAECLKKFGFANEDEFAGLVATKEQLELIERELQEYHKAVELNREKLAVITEDCKEIVLADEPALQEVRRNLQEKLDLVRTQQGEMNNRISVNTSRAGNIRSLQEVYEKLLRLYSVEKRLSDLLSGQVSGNRITFEQYVQSADFDRIIAAANRRLMPMSDGQYEMRRRENSCDARTQSFLALEVRDNFTGYFRPVGNLSGGESFQASLSLALGLSDVISASHGGVQMDALFIDEGFGTLDRQAIDHSMDILKQLSGTSKLVGVISHREELANEIEQRLVVRKGKNGSTIEQVI